MPKARACRAPHRAGGPARCGARAGCGPRAGAGGERPVQRCDKGLRPRGGRGAGTEGARGGEEARSYAAEDEERWALPQAAAAGSASPRFRGGQGGSGCRNQPHGRRRRRRARQRLTPPRPAGGAEPPMGQLLSKQRASPSGGRRRGKVPLRSCFLRGPCMLCFVVHGSARASPGPRPGPGPAEQRAARRQRLLLLLLLRGLLPPEPAADMVCKRKGAGLPACPPCKQPRCAAAAAACQCPAEPPPLCPPPCAANEGPAGAGDAAPPSPGPQPPPPHGDDSAEPGCQEPAEPPGDACREPPAPPPNINQLPPSILLKVRARARGRAGPGGSPRAGAAGGLVPAPLAAGPPGCQPLRPGAGTGAEFGFGAQAPSLPERLWRPLGRPAESVGKGSSCPCGVC